jgi:replication-associated recombination protein RarA
MSNQVERFKHSKRVAKKQTKLARKMGLAKAYGYDHVLKNPHKYAKQSMFHCGNASCFMCGNPRKVFKEKTMQERRFEQVKDDE